MNLIIFILFFILLNDRVTGSLDNEGFYHDGEFHINLKDMFDKKLLNEKGLKIKQIGQGRFSLPVSNVYVLLVLLFYFYPFSIINRNDRRDARNRLYAKRLGKSDDQLPSHDR